MNPADIIAGSMETYRRGHTGADSKSVCGQPHVGSNPTVSARKRQIPTGICRFQLNPPLRVGEIVFDDEIQLRWMKFASTASGWI